MYCWRWQPEAAYQFDALRLWLGACGTKWLILRLIRSWIPWRGPRNSDELALSAGRKHFTLWYMARWQSSRHNAIVWSLLFAFWFADHLSGLLIQLLAYFGLTLCESIPHSRANTFRWGKSKHNTIGDRLMSWVGDQYLNACVIHPQSRSPRHSIWVKFDSPLLLNWTRQVNELLVYYYTRRNFDGCTPEKERRNALIKRTESKSKSRTWGSNLVHGRVSEWVSVCICICISDFIFVAFAAQFAFIC